MHNVILHVLPVPYRVLHHYREEKCRSTPQRTTPIATSLSSLHGLLKTANFLFVISARELLCLKVVLRRGPPLVIDCDWVAAKVGEAAVLSGRFVELDNLGLVCLRFNRIIAVGIRYEICVIV